MSACGASLIAAFPAGADEERETPAVGVRATRTAQGETGRARGMPTVATTISRSPSPMADIACRAGVVKKREKPPAAKGRAAPMAQAGMGKARDTLTAMTTSHCLFPMVPKKGVKLDEEKES